MKRYISVAAVFLFFLLLLGLILFKILGPSTSEEKEVVSQNPFAGTQVTTKPVYTDTPNRTVVSCYAWYLGVHLTSATLDQIADEPQARACFTRSFISKWNDIEAETEASPMLTVLDFGPTWRSSITTEAIGQSIKSVDELVTLGRGEDAFKLKVHVVQEEDDTWKIDSVSQP